MPNWIEYVLLSGFKTDYMMFADSHGIDQEIKLKKTINWEKFSKKPFWGYELEYKSTIGAKPAPAWPMATQSLPF